MIQRILSRLFPYEEPSVIGMLLATRGSVTYRKTPFIRLLKMKLWSDQ